MNSDYPQEPGIYEGIAFAEYCAWPFVNNSSLSAALKSGAHYKSYVEQQQHRNEKRDSMALMMGRFLHAGCFEPHTLLMNYVVQPATLYDFVTTVNGDEPANPANTKEGRKRLSEWKQTVDGKEVVTQEDLDTLAGVLQSINTNRVARDCVSHAGPAEVSIVWDDRLTGVRCKARIDKWDPRRNLIADLKSTQDACDFNKSIGRYSYHRQAAFYQDGIEAVTQQAHQCWFVPVEKVPPYVCRAAQIHEDSVDAGREQYQQALRTAASLAKGNATSTFPRGVTFDFKINALSKEASLLRKC